VTARAFDDRRLPWITGSAVVAIARRSAPRHERSHHGVDACARTTRGPTVAGHPPGWAGDSELTTARILAQLCDELLAGIDELRLQLCVHLKTLPDRLAILTPSSGVPATQRLRDGHPSAGREPHQPARSVSGYVSPYL
jgi:hypothetical protein